MRCSRRLQKSIKLLILKVQGLSKSQMLIRLKSSSLVLVVIGSIPMLICNRFHERLANNGKITTFNGYCSLMLSCAGFLERRKSRLGPSKSMFSAENFTRSLSCISQLVSAQFALELCLAAKNRQKSIKLILTFKIIQGR